MRSNYLSEDEFYKYVRKSLSKKKINDIFDRYGITVGRCNLFSDFIENLSKTIHRTYLGSEFIKNQKQTKGHLKWCFNDTRRSFFQYDFYFKFDEDLFEFFKDFYMLMYYDVPDDDKEESLNSGIDYWQYIFNFKGNKTQLELDDFMRLYWLFSVSLDPTLKEDDNIKQKSLNTIFLDKKRTNY